MFGPNGADYYHNFISSRLPTARNKVERGKELSQRQALGTSQLEMFIYWLHAWLVKF